MSTSFLVYYQVNPTLQRAFVVGVLPLKIDADNTEFWLAFNQPQPPSFDAYQYKEQEIKNVQFLHKMTRQLQEFIHSTDNADVSIHHYDYEYMLSKAYL